MKLNAESLRLCRGVKKQTKNKRVRVVVMLKQWEKKKKGNEEAEVVELD